MPDTDFTGLTTREILCMTDAELMLRAALDPGATPESREDALKDYRAELLRRLIEAKYRTAQILDSDPATMPSPVASASSGRSARSAY